MTQPKPTTTQPPAATSNGRPLRIRSGVRAGEDKSRGTYLTIELQKVIICS